MASRDDQKERVQQATDIVRLIGEQIALRPKGSEYVGLCPFHDDSKPSLYVSPAKQIYKCFSCGAGGDVFSFAVNYHKMAFPEALRYLAERTGIELERSGADKAHSDQRQRIADANQQALEFFRHQFKDDNLGRIARDYIQQRGIQSDMVAAFQLGYAPDSWDALAQTIGRRKWDAQGFLDAGLIAERKRRGQGAEGSRGQVQAKERGSTASEHSAPRPLGPSTPSQCYDRLRHRLIFPIFDAIGRPIAFGGRVLPQGTIDDPTTDAKYLNSPETPLFNKSATLYGIHLAKKPIIDSKTAVIVEGYTDVIACHQAGAKNVVATLGTALTSEHVRELRRYAEKVVLVFDADAAGQKAADRAVELFLAGELDVAIAILPQGEKGGGLDPADLLTRDDGYDQWCTLIDEAGDALSYQFERVREQLAAASSVTGRQHVAEAYLGRLAQLGLSRTGPIRRAFVVQRLAQLLHMNDSAVNELLTRATQQAAPRRTAAVQRDTEAAQRMADGPPDYIAEENEASASSDNLPSDVASPVTRSRLKAIQAAERQLVGCLIRDNELFHYTLQDGYPLDEAVAPGDLVTPIGRQLYERIYEQLSGGQNVSLTSLLGDLAAETPDAEQARHLTDLATEADADVDRAVRGDAERMEELVATAAQAIRAYHRQQQHVVEKRQWRAIEDDQEKIRKAQRLLEGLREPSPARIARPSSS